MILQYCWRHFCNDSSLVIFQNRGGSKHTDRNGQRTRKPRLKIPAWYCPLYAMTAQTCQDADPIKWIEMWKVWRPNQSLALLSCSLTHCWIIFLFWQGSFFCAVGGNVAMRGCIWCTITCKWGLHVDMDARDDSYSFAPSGDKIWRQKEISSWASIDRGAIIYLPSSCFHCKL